MKSVFIYFEFLENEILLTFCTLLGLDLDACTDFVVIAISFLDKDIQGTHQMQLSFHCPQCYGMILCFSGKLTFVLSLQ